MKKDSARKDRFTWKEGDVEIISAEESQKRLKESAKKSTSAKDGKSVSKKR